MQETWTSSSNLIPPPAREGATCPIARVDIAFAAPHASPTSSFREFHRRASEGARLNVVFFGSSLTWGARASDPQTTSFRAIVGQKLQAAYPQSHFTLWDAAIGGTTSQLGMFRLERDVLSRSPDLVFIDFSVNDNLCGDDPAQLVSYESIVRRLVLHGCCVVQVIFTTHETVTWDDLSRLKRRIAHQKIAEAYSTAVGDVVTLIQARLQAGLVRLDDLWPADDFVHPTDIGYKLYAESAWHAFVTAIARGLVCSAPHSPLHSDADPEVARVRFSAREILPPGWKRDKPNTTAAFHDMLMSRWLDDEIIASNDDWLPDSRVSRLDPPAALCARFTGSTALIFGESTLSSCAFSVSIDGGPPCTHDAAALAKFVGGNTHLAITIATDLDPHIEHDVKILPLFNSESPQELRLESLCVAGPIVTVVLD